MIVVFLSATHPPLVFETTPALFIAHAVDAAAATRTLPEAGEGMTFEQAWAAVTQDLRSAYHFPDLESARRHFENDDALALHARATILSVLERLGRATTAV